MRIWYDKSSMKKQRTTKYEIRALRERINKLVGEGFTYEEIARLEKLSGKQMVWYHFRGYYQKNKEKEKQRVKKWVRENREKSREYFRKYDKKHKKLKREYKRKWEKLKRHINPKYRLDSNISVAIGTCLKGKKNWRKWEGLVGYFVEDLIIHLEKIFDDKMSWDNYGSYWHVDHIKPKSLFKYETAEDPEFKKCWALENLQPLEKIANIKKGNKMVAEPAETGKY